MAHSHCYPSIAVLKACPNEMYMWRFFYYPTIHCFYLLIINVKDDVFMATRRPNDDLTSEYEI